MLAVNPKAVYFLDSSEAVTVISDVRVIVFTATCIRKESEQLCIVHQRSLQTKKTSFGPLEFWGVPLPRAYSALFFSNSTSESVCVRGGEEQCRLGPSQFVRSENPDCYTYTEHGSKIDLGDWANLG